jgi:hypothetical protein
MKDNQNNTIEIIYRNIPKEIIEDFTNSDKITAITSEGRKESNFTGGPQDVIIYVAKVIADGVIFNIISLPLILTWKKLKKYYADKKTPIEEDKNYIDLRFKLSNEGEIEFHLKGNVSDEQIEKSTENIFNYLNDSKTLNSDLENPDYIVPESRKPRIRMKYNIETKKWEPVNFKELKAFWDAKIAESQNKYFE